MKIGTWSIVVGTNACNAKCPYCVAKMTSKETLPTRINWHNFEIAKKLADKKGVTTVLLTGKGEPTLYPHQIMEYLKNLKEFPFIELQTNGIELASPDFEQWLQLWYLEGLTTICISVVDYDSEKNGQIYKSYYDLRVLIQRLHNIGYSVRLNIIGIRGYIDTVSELMEFLNFARENEVEQVTYRPVSLPDITENREVWDWVKKHQVFEDNMYKIKAHLHKYGKKIMTLPHGAQVFDYDGQNICLADCLTINKETDDLRQIIFFPDGAIRYDWRYKGARLL